MGAEREEGHLSACHAGNACDGLASFPSSTWQLGSVDALTRRTELLGMVV